MFKINQKIILHKRKLLESLSIMEDLLLTDSVSYPSLKKGNDLKVELFNKLFSFDEQNLIKELNKNGFLYQFNDYQEDGCCIEIKLSSQKDQ